MRLIDADALMYRVTEETREAPNWDYAVGYRDAINRVQCMIGEAPTVAEDSNVPVKQPDPDTGLVPCGCGGSASCHVSYDDEKWVTTVKIVCNKCLINVALLALYELRGEEALADDAKRAWNKAMGWRVEE